MNLKRALSLILVLIMIFSCQGFSAFAAEQEAEEVVLFGSFNNFEGVKMELHEGTTYKTTLALEEGSYNFYVKCGDKQYSYPGTIKDTTSKVTESGFMFSSDVRAGCTFVASGGSYTFSFNTDACTLKVENGIDTEIGENTQLTVKFGNDAVNAQVGDILTYSVYLYSDKLLEDIQAALNYNSQKIKLISVSEENSAVNYPNLTEAVFNPDLQGVVTLNGTFINGYDFTEEKLLLTLDFEVMAGGETALEFNVQEMTATDSTAYFSFSKNTSEGALLRETLEAVSEAEPVEFTGCTITLTGQIAVNFHMDVSDDVLGDETAQMVFTLPNGSKKYVAVQDATEHDGSYVFTCKIAAKEMASVVKAQIVTADYESEVFEYSVKQYAEYILEKAEEDINSHNSESEYAKAADLVRAMLNYGASAQVFFGYNKENLANASLTNDEKELADADLSAYCYSLTGKEEGVSYYGSRLSLESETALKHYFYIEDENNIPEIFVNGQPATVSQANGYYEVKISDILAQNLDDEIVVSIGSLTLNYNAFSYGYLAKQENDTNLKNVINALRTYNLEAERY
ncbi:MAG: hypothetical protein IJW04_01715 [Ruminococcus sp.]|nr:hypothetical protein [Ruminococcus sp.]